MKKFVRGGGGVDSASRRQRDSEGKSEKEGNKSLKVGLVYKLHESNPKM
jgi:hypothetical protein